jgi:hypothetical protein
MQSVSIDKGYILIYRLLDIAEEIDLAAAERILKERTGLSRLRLTRSTRQAFQIRNAPILVSLGETNVRTGTQTHRAETYAKIWEYGVISFQFQLQIPPGTSWSDLVGWASIIELDSSFDEAARRHGNEMTRTLEKALKGLHEWEGNEDYAVYFLERINGIEKASQLFQAADIPALIVGEPAIPLAPKIRVSIEESVIQYGDGDLAVVDWNSAVVVEPTGQRDVVDVLEFAVTHLMEFRYYDDLLDKRLDYLYESIEKRRGSILMGRYSKLSHEASSRFIEFSEFIERVENSLKVVGDFYLANVFRMAVNRFRLRDWEDSVTRKMNLLARVSELLQGEVNVQRSHWLEIIIIALIAFEIVSALLKNVIP